MERGYVKLWRKIEESAVFDDAELLRLWIWLLMNARRKTVTLSNGVTIGPGQVAISTIRLGERFRCAAGTIHRRLARLKTEGQISTFAHKSFTVVTICNWETYQSQEEETRTPGAKLAQTSRKPRAKLAHTEQERENGRMEEGENKIPPKPPKGEEGRRPPPKPVEVTDLAFPPELDNDRGRQAVSDWLAYKRRKGQGYKEAGHMNRLLIQYAGDFGQEAAAALEAAVNHSIGCNYAGCVVPKEFQAKRGSLKKIRAGAGQLFNANGKTYDW